MSKSKSNLDKIPVEGGITTDVKNQNRSIERRAHLIITEIGLKQKPEDVIFPKPDTGTFVAGYFTLGEMKSQQYAVQICFDIGAKWEKTFHESVYNNISALCKKGVGNIWGITDYTAKEVFDESIKADRQLS
jgi:hypothetical protein